MLDKASCREWAAKAKAHPSGFTAHKIELPRTDPAWGKGRSGIPDNAHDSAALSHWSEKNGRHYLFFKELPGHHWWPGDGIGVSWTDR